MMKKRLIWLIAAALVLAVGIGSTVAYLIASSNTLENTFTVGNVGLTLHETTGTRYKLAPGVTLAKDPRITVQAGSDACYVFVQVQSSNQFDAYCAFEMQGQWLPLEGHNGIYYQTVDKSLQPTVLGILEGDCITVHPTLTEQQLEAISEYPTLKFTAYAVQQSGFATAAQAWQVFN